MSTSPGGPQRRANRGLHAYSVDSTLFSCGPLSAEAGVHLEGCREGVMSTSPGRPDRCSARGTGELRVVRARVVAAHEEAAGAAGVQAAGINPAGGVTGQ